MDFHPSEPFDTNRGQHILWRGVKQAFADDEGLAYYRFPIYQPDGLKRWEVDVLLVLRKQGIFLLESKGCRILNIDSIHGHAWSMNDWHREQETPIAQVNDQELALRNLLDQDEELKGQLRFHHRVVLPFVSQAEWQNRSFHELPSAGGVALKEDIEPAVLREWISRAHQVHPQAVLTDAQWARLKQRLNGIQAIPTDASPGTIHLLTYSGDPPSKEQLREWIPALQHPNLEGCSYLTATAALARHRAGQGFCPEHQIRIVDRPDDDDSPREEPQVVFHEALRHWTRSPLLTRAEERTLLKRTMEEIAQDDEVRARQLRHDVFAWRDALSELEQEGIDLTQAIPPEIRQQLVHPELGGLLQQLQRNFRQRQQAQGSSRTFETTARDFLRAGYVPTKTVILEGFSWLLPLQRYFIQRCSEMGATVFLLIPYNPAQAYGFSVVRSSYSAWWPDRQEYDSTTQKAPADLVYLQQNLFSDAPTVAPPDRDGSVTLNVCQHRHQEVSVCLERLQAYIDAGHEPRDLALVTRDAAEYTPLILEEAELRGLDHLFRVPPRMLLLTPLGRFVLHLFEVWKDGSLQMNADQFEAFLASGLLGVEVQKSVDRFHAVRCQMFERCSTAASWAVGLQQLKSLSEKLSDRSRLPASQVQPGTVALWEKVIGRITHLCTDLFDGQERSIGEHIRRLQDVLTTVDVHTLRASERAVLERLQEAMAHLSEANSLALSTTEFGEVLNGLVQERQKEEEESDDPRGHHILLLSPESLDSLKREVVFFLGVDHQNVPRPYTDSWPLVRNEVAVHQLRERYLFLAVVRAAQQHLHLSFPLVTQAQHRRPSLYLTEVTRLLSISSSGDAGDAVEEAEDPVSSIAPAPIGRARRQEYTLEEIALFALCPYRYKLERISSDARTYKTTWQVRFAAQGMWLDRILGQLQAEGQRQRGQQPIREWLWDAVTKTESEVRAAFPALRSGEWLTVRQRLYGDMRYFMKRFLEQDYLISIEAIEPLDISVVDGERGIKVASQLKYAYRRGKYLYPILKEVQIEGWLQFDKQPDNEDGQPPQTHLVEGVRVFRHQYDALSWWREITRRALFRRENKGNHNFLRDLRDPAEDLSEIRGHIQAMEAGAYPKNPGSHCKYCPLRGDCMGLAT